MPDIDNRIKEILNLINIIMIKNHIPWLRVKVVKNTIIVEMKKISESRFNLIGDIISS